MIRLADWFFAARPLLHIPGWSIYLIALHYHHELSGGHFEFTDALVLFGLSLLAAGGFYLNQVTDLESDRINQKCFFLPHGILRREQFVKAFVVCSIPAIGLAAIISAPTLLIFAQLFVLMYVYSASPFRWKDNIIGGFVVNAYGNGFLVAMAVMPDISSSNSGTLGWDNPFYFLLAVGGTYLLTTIPDREGDSVTAKATIAVKWGQAVTMALAILLFFVAHFIAQHDGRAALSWVALGATLLSFLAFIVRRHALVMLAIKLPILALALLAGWFYPVYLAVVVACLLAARVYYRKRFGIVYPRLAA